MKAEEFYRQLEEKQEFTELTNTGINTNYKNVFDFAERYAQQRGNEVLDRAIDKLKVDFKGETDYTIGLSEGLELAKDRILKLKNNEK